MLSTEPGTCGRLHVNSSSYHSKHSPAPRLSPTWLVYPYSAFTLLPPFNLFITGLTEEQRKHQDQTHQIGNFCFSSFFLLFITREHTTFRHATLLFHPQYTVCAVCFISTITRSNIPINAFGFTLRSKYFNNNAMKCL